MVYLAGKDGQGKTLYVEENGTPHMHKVKQEQQQQQGSTTTVVTEHTSLKIINAKLDRIISLLESQKKQE
jgi:hypothetical protein